MVLQLPSEGNKIVCDDLEFQVRYVLRAVRGPRGPWCYGADYLRGLLQHIKGYSSVDSTIRGIIFGTRRQIYFQHNSSPT
jgi:hypothetical protein